MFLNIGPQHPATHGLFRVVVGLRDEEIVTRAARHRLPPPRRREDGRAADLAHVHPVHRPHRLSGRRDQQPPVGACRGEAVRGRGPRARPGDPRDALASSIASRATSCFYGTFAQDVGAISPVFYMFDDRERIFDVVGAICGARMHPNWFRIGGVARGPARRLGAAPPRLRRLPARAALRVRPPGDATVASSERARSGWVPLAPRTHVEWGVTGPDLRAAGVPWDWRKQRPYSHYDWFDFDVPVGTTGDCFDRVAVRVEEMRQSLRIIRQCLDAMPAGPYKSPHPLATPPAKEPGTMHHIETLITHFLGVSWGRWCRPARPASTPRAPRGSTAITPSATGRTAPTARSIRTPSFPHLQVLPLLATGYEIADL